MNRLPILLAIVLIAMSSLARGASCTVNAPGLSFGSVDVTAGKAKDSSGSITVTCTGNSGEVVSYTLSATLPPGYASSRALASGANNLRYNLFVDVARAVVFGDGTSGSTPIGGTLTLSSSQTQKVETVFSRIEAHQPSVPPGLYGDTVLLTITY